MAASNSSKMSSSNQLTKIQEYFAGMVGSYSLQDVSRNLSYLQDQSHKTLSSSHCKNRYSTPLPEDWAALHSYSALSQCLPVESSPQQHELLGMSLPTCPTTECQESRYERCSTPDIIQSVLQLEHDVSPISKQTTPESLIDSTSAVQTSPIATPTASIWKSPGGREYMDSGYLSEDSLSTSSFLHKASTSPQDTKIPPFVSTFCPSLAAITTDANHGQTAIFQHCIKTETNITTCSSSSSLAYTKYEPISPVQISHVTSDAKRKKMKPRPLPVSPVNIQSSQVSTSEDQVKKKVKPCQSMKRKLSDTDLSENNVNADAKRGRHNEPLNHRAIMIMTLWYNQHQENPYPSKKDKEKMAAEGGIKVAQVKSWFANKRNRNNNTRPKVQKQQLQDRLKTLCSTLAKDQEQNMDNSFIIQQLSSLISSAQR